MLAGWSSFELASWTELSMDERRAFIKEGLLMSSTGDPLPHRGEGCSSPLLRAAQRVRADGMLIGG